MLRPLYHLVNKPSGTGNITTFSNKNTCTAIINLENISPRTALCTGFSHYLDGFRQGYGGSLRSTHDQCLFDEVCSSGRKAWITVAGWFHQTLAPTRSLSLPKRADTHTGLLQAYAYQSTTYRATTHGFQTLGTMCGTPTDTDNDKGTWSLTTWCKNGLRVWTCTGISIYLITELQQD